MASAKRKRKKASNGKKASVIGRPTLKTPETLDRVTTALRAGVDYRTAAFFAGVSERTLRSWREGDAELSAAMEQAKAGAVVGVAVHLMKKIHGGDTSAMKFFLSTHAPEFREAPSVAVQVNNHSVDGPPTPSSGDLVVYLHQLNEVAAALVNQIPDNHSDPTDPENPTGTNGHVTNGTNG